MGAAPAPQATELPALDAQQVIIQHVDTVNIYTQLPSAEVSHG